MTDPEDLSVEAEPAPARGPGHDLANARERAGIAREEMARTLRLSSGQLEALERDDYARLPPPTFVRGYLRAYARHLSLAPEEMVAAYDAQGGAVRDPDLHTTTPAAAVAAGRGPLIGFLLVALVAGGGAVTWWLQTGRLAGSETPVAQSNEAEAAQATAEADSSSSPSAGGSSDTATAPDASTADALADAGGSGQSDAIEPAAGDPDDSGQAGAEAVDTGTGSAAQADDTRTGQDSISQASTDQDGASQPGDSGGEAAPAQDAMAQAETEAAAAGGDTGQQGAAEPGEATAAASESTAAASANGESTETGADASTEAVEPSGSDASPVQTASAEAATTGAATEGPDTLRLTFEGDSWLEITDKRGRELAYTLYLGTRPVTVRGWAPFEVYLGNSPAVEVQLNGEPVDKSAFTQSDNTGGFLVGANGARPR